MNGAVYQLDSPIPSFESANRVSALIGNRINRLSVDASLVVDGHANLDERRPSIP
jgi:hypothetical protein